VKTYNWERIAVIIFVVGVTIGTFVMLFTRSL